MLCDRASICWKNIVDIVDFSSVGMVSDPDLGLTSHDKLDPDPDPTSHDNPDPDPWFFSRPYPDPDNFVLNIFHLIYDDF